jgi:hypothetical protein
MAKRKRTNNDLENTEQKTNNSKMPALERKSREITN